MKRLALILAFGVVACAATHEEPDDSVVDPFDLEDVDDGKADANDPLGKFNPHRIVSDDAFFDVDAIDAAGVQRFLEVSPYDGKRSFLADHRLDSGERVSAALVRVARANGLNPIVLLATLQKEAGLISKSVAPSAHRVDFAFGCGCPDGGPCMAAFRGLDKQLECAGERMAEYMADLLDGEPTIAGFFPGESKRVLDGSNVVSANRSTAILYTYTPWILVGRGGNWLFWNVWRRYSVHLSYDRGLNPPFNEGYIGGLCTTSADCFYDGGVCSGGECTQSCTSSCPDRIGPGFATTFCVTDPVTSAGRCVAQCDSLLASGGCGPLQTCVSATRHNQPSAQRDVCLR
jgi:hypothetical protein